MKLLLLLATLAHGQAPPGELDMGAGLIEGVAPGPPPTTDEVDARSLALGQGLRCPVCQALSVADSSSEAAVMFQRRIRELVAAGYSDEQIELYFIERYGDWILLDPPAEGLNWVLWLVPGLICGGGLAWSAAVVAQWKREPDDELLPSDQGLVPKDRYEQALLAELEDD